MRPILIANYAPWMRGVDLYLRGDKGLIVAEPLVLRQLEEGATVPAPLLHLEEGGVKSLMDDFWRAGFRPSPHYFQASPDRLHLEDMRAIVAAKLGVKLPEGRI